MQSGVFKYSLQFTRVPPEGEQPLEETFAFSLKT